MVKARAGSVYGEPSMAINDRPLRIEYCPVIRAARDGVQAGSTKNWVSRNPSPASWSIRGVGAPRSSPPPYGPKSPYPTLSARMKTTFGFCCADVCSLTTTMVANTANTASQLRKMAMVYSTRRL